ncbi:hypothetical protein AAF712_005854 [Marasmius tenuissimus]|uniref:Uncharacterized protein n=1 Tax=Marasmius tenuissimus TaxID=585030 RepID=A0ABR2ZZD2_9AGAR
MQNLHRTASLNLCVLEPDVLSHITGPAPRLHSLHLTSRSQDSYGPMFFPGPINPLTIPDGLLNGLPGLRKLVIETVLSHYNLSDLAQNLTYLHLTLFSDHGSERLRPSLPETLRIIYAARKLETLSLERKHRGDHWNTPRIPPHNPL